MVDSELPHLRVGLFFLDLTCYKSYIYSIYMTERIINNLKHHRRLAGFKQADFPYTQAYISRIEAGLSAPGPDVARVLAKFYGLSLRGFWESWSVSKAEPDDLEGQADAKPTE